MTNIRLSAPLGDWRTTFVRWVSELRKIPFVFKNDRNFYNFDPTVKLFDALGAEQPLPELLVQYAQYCERESFLEVRLMVEANIAILNPVKVTISLPKPFDGKIVTGFYATIVSYPIFAVFGGTPCIARAFLQQAEKNITVDAIATPMAAGRLQINIHSFVYQVKR